MTCIIVADDAKQWPFLIPNVEVIDAMSYIMHPELTEKRGVKIFNLCKSYRYQTSGYYVSLLGEARGHKPFPSVVTIQDMRSTSQARLVSDELDDLIHKQLSNIQSDKFTLSIYFGKNMTEKYDRLCLALFNLYQAPLLRAQFSKNSDGDWSLRSVSTIAASEVPVSHHPFVLESATKFFNGRQSLPRKKLRFRYDMAILHNPKDPQPPSNEKALKKFIKAAESMGINAELIEADDYAHLSEYDALFIRETTRVNHHTYRFARRAEREGLIVIDDPQSIVRCTNKVYLAELMSHHELPTPKALVINKHNKQRIIDEIGFPCVLKKPDTAFSVGVVKAKDEDELKEKLDDFFQESEMVVAQEFMKSAFDWRITIINGTPLFACKYYMVDNHWQIISNAADGSRDYGRFECLPIEMAPRKCVMTALKGANLIGDGLYGVDLKEVDGKFYIIEINDNPSIDAGVEDEVLRDELYRRIMSVFLSRIEHRKARIFRNTYD